MAKRQMVYREIFDSRVVMVDPTREGKSIDDFLEEGWLVKDFKIAGHLGFGDHSGKRFPCVVYVLEKDA